MKTRRLSDVTRQGSANKFAESLMPAAPKQRGDVDNTTPPELPPFQPEVEQVQRVEPTAKQIKPSITLEEAQGILTRSEPVTTKPERARKSSSLSFEDIINTPAKEGSMFNKMVRVTDENHELLRLLAFKYRKPMNVIVHNLLGFLDQAYQKEQQKDV